MMAGFVLIHSPIAAPITWAPVAEALEERGYEAIVPALVADVSPPFWPQYAQLVAQAVDKTAVENRALVLVAHSAAGLLIPAARAAMSDRRIGGYILVDASLPQAGATLVELIPASAGVGIDQLRAQANGGLLPPWGKGWTEETWQQLIPDRILRKRFRDGLQPVPLALYEERLPSRRSWPDAPCSYLRFSALYEDSERQARQLGCHTRVIAGGHLHMLVEPAAIAEALIGLAKAMAGAEATGFS